MAIKETRDRTDLKNLSIHEIRKEIQSEMSWLRTKTSLSTTVYGNFELIMIAFLLVLSIFSRSLLALGYFIFCMILIYHSGKFLADDKAQNFTKVLLGKCLLPYLLIDILLQLIY
jgi:hypothetical protein